MKNLENLKSENEIEKIAKTGCCREDVATVFFNEH